MLRRSSMSRAELARATGLSRAATSLIAEELLKDGIVMELPPQSVGRGRSATPLAVRADSYYALAVDLARKSCSVGLCDMSGHLLQFRAFPDQDGLLDLIIEALRRMAQSVDKSKILGIGISSPGPLDCEGGKIYRRCKLKTSAFLRPLLFGTFPTPPGLCPSSARRRAIRLRSSPARTKPSSATRARCGSCI